MDPKQTLDAVEGLEEAALAMRDDFRYIPVGHGEKQAVLMTQYMPVPWADVFLFLAQRGWRRHDELALLKPRRIVGGVFDDLVAYVPVDEPDDPISMPPAPYEPDRQPAMSDLPWTVKPEVSEQFEEREDDD